MIRMRFILSLVLLVSSLLVSAQEAERPKVGVVLSGGGALGFAHIGVLKKTEEAGIRTDYITGTSMGAIIGGLYAYGYSPEQIEELVKWIDWKELMNPKVNR